MSNIAHPFLGSWGYMHDIPFIMVSSPSLSPTSMYFCASDHFKVCRIRVSPTSVHSFKDPVHQTFTSARIFVWVFHFSRSYVEFFWMPRIMVCSTRLHICHWSTSMVRSKTSLRTENCVHKPDCQLPIQSTSIQVAPVNHGLSIELISQSITANKSGSTDDYRI